MTGGGPRISVIGAVLALCLTTACGGGIRTSLGKEPPLENYTAEQIYERGEFELSQNDASRAAFYFGEIERLYPYSDWGKRALIMQAFAYHRDKDYENSRAAAQRYIDFYPLEDDAAYAQYLLALSYYDQIEEVGRDQGLTFQALQSLRTVIERYPESEYARSSVLKFDLAFDHLAGKEMEIGRYYLKRGNYGAAINRFRVRGRGFPDHDPYRRGAAPACRILPVARAGPGGADCGRDPRVQLPVDAVVPGQLQAAHRARPRTRGGRRQLAGQHLSSDGQGPVVVGWAGRAPI